MQYLHQLHCNLTLTALELTFPGTLRGKQILKRVN